MVSRDAFIYCHDSLLFAPCAIFISCVSKTCVILHVCSYHPLCSLLRLLLSMFTRQSIRHPRHPHGHARGRSIYHRIRHPLHRSPSRRHHHPTNKSGSHQGGNLQHHAMSRYGQTGPITRSHSPRSSHGILQPLLPIRN